MQFLNDPLDIHIAVMNASLLDESSLIIGD
jgi:hypothetical protein